MYLESNVVKTNSVLDIQHDDDVGFFYPEKEEYKIETDKNSMSGREQAEGVQVEGSIKERKGPVLEGGKGVWK